VRDSGLRPTPPHLLERATIAALEHARDTELVSLDNLAREFRVHQRTLRAAARTGRLQVTFSSRSAFGRPIRLATRAAARAFMRKDYRRYGGQSPAVAPLPSPRADERSSGPGVSWCTGRLFWRLPRRFSCGDLVGARASENVGQRVVRLVAGVFKHSLR
jgi:hypothetical protein